MWKEWRCMWKEWRCMWKGGRGRRPDQVEQRAYYCPPYLHTDPALCTCVLPLHASCTASVPRTCVLRVCPEVGQVKPLLTAAHQQLQLLCVEHGDPLGADLDVCG